MGAAWPPARHAGRHGEVTLQFALGVELADATLEVELAAQHLQGKGEVVTIRLAPAHADVERQRHAVHRGLAGNRERSPQRTDMGRRLDLLGLDGLARLRIGVAQRALHDPELADRQVEALGRRARGLTGAGAWLELPVGHASGVGLEHDGRLVEGETADLDLAAQQRPPRWRGADPAHVDHLCAFGARRVGEVHALGADPGHRQHPEPHRAVDHQLAAGRLLDGLDESGLVGLDVDDVGRRDSGSQQRAEQRRNSPRDPSAHRHGHRPGTTPGQRPGCWPKRSSACRMRRWRSIPEIDLDVHQSAKIIRRTGRPDGMGEAC